MLGKRGVAMLQPTERIRLVRGFGVGYSEVALEQG